MQKRYYQNRHGFTLLEMVIAIFVVALITSAAVPMINGMTNAYMRTAALKIAGNIKFLYDRAILDQVYVRLVFDLDQHAYWAETTKDPFFLSQKPMSVEEGAVVIEDEEDELQQEIDEEVERLYSDALTMDQETFKWQGWGDFASKFKKKKAEFSQYTTELSRKTELPSQVRFFKMDTQSVEEPVSQGQVYVHMFPNGFVERSAIYITKTSDYEDEELRPEDYEVFSIIVEPLTGRAKIYNSYVELPEEQEDEEEW